MSRDMDWREQAACRTSDPEIFFPRGSARDMHRQERRAQAICAPCPVAGRCLEVALRFDGVDGIWAGTTPYQRDVVWARSIA